MGLSKRYKSGNVEPNLSGQWEEDGTYQFDLDSNRPRYTIDTPPPTVSGKLHIGHVYSYSHADFFARFWRMKGLNILYPMGYDDNGLPTERLVEKEYGVSANDIGRQAFIEKCLEISKELEKEYETLWRRLGLSIDWRFTYRTIDTRARRLCQLSFLDLYEKGMAYRQKAPTIWCPECRTAIAQAELDDLDRDTEFVTLKFELEDGTPLPIATTRPELLCACAAIFVHPADQRYEHLIGSKAQVPIYDRWVDILADESADPEKGTGVVMCCTFGDATDVSWWYRYDLPLIEAIGRDGCMTAPAEQYEGLSISSARKRIKSHLYRDGHVLSQHSSDQSVRVHERCDTPVEYVVAKQWFIRVLDFKDELIEAGTKVDWYPPFMETRYKQWVENLNWDWCISRQRYFGVTFPIWYCRDCGEVRTADKEMLPVDPTIQQPSEPCHCGSTSFEPEYDIMDTWATSSMTPQLVADWLGESGFDNQSFVPLSMRPQAHEIIRTWAFYSIAKSYHHFGLIPWKEAAISGWAIAGKGSEKISKSRGGGPAPPLQMLETYSADAVRYWAASTSLGKDAIISEEKIMAGSKLVNKLWNAARFASRFLQEEIDTSAAAGHFSPADRWILSGCNRLIDRVTDSMSKYDNAAAKNEIELFFWTDFADNYLEMAKKRLYDHVDEKHAGAVYALRLTLVAILKLFAPFLPFVTEQIYLGMFAEEENGGSIHRSVWPESDHSMISNEADALGEILVEIATAVRRYKSKEGMSLGSEIGSLILGGIPKEQIELFTETESDLLSVTRARELILSEGVGDNGVALGRVGQIEVSLLS